MRLNLALILFAIVALLRSVTDAQDCKKTVRRPKKVIKNGVKVTEFFNVEVKVCCKGYAKYRGRRTCQPVCENLCENAKCTAPNVCTCNSGYTKLNDFRCEPQCDNCKFGFCSAPGVCDCYRGYERNPLNGTCMPACGNPCVNGYCSDPDFCTCYDGYRMSNENPYTCALKETVQTATVIETSSKIIETSSTVDSSTRITNFESVSESTFSSPTSSFTDFVEITSGTEENNKTDTVSVKDSTGDFTNFEPTYRTLTLSTQSEYCDSNCYPGKCVQGICHCDKGFTYRNNKCIKDCELTCRNGFCNEDNSCECSNGYELKNQTYCIPVCTFGCANGLCVEPERCECSNGLMVTSDPNEDCIPKCGLEGCTNGTCIAPDICQCYQGYIESSVDPFVCFLNTTEKADYISVVKKHASTAKVGLIWLFVLIPVIGFAGFILIKCYLLRKFSGNAYNVDRLEKKKRTVIYSSERDNVITA